MLSWVSLCHLVQNRVREWKFPEDIWKCVSTWQSDEVVDFQHVLQLLPLQSKCRASLKSPNSSVLPLRSESECPLFLLHLPLVKRCLSHGHPLELKPVCSQPFRIWSDCHVCTAFETNVWNRRHIAELACPMRILLRQGLSSQNFRKEHSWSHRSIHQSFQSKAGRQRTVQQTGLDHELVWCKRTGPRSKRQIQAQACVCPFSCSNKEEIASNRKCFSERDQLDPPVHRLRSLRVGRCRSLRRVHRWETQ